MNVYHITYCPANETASLYFWGCNFGCRGCIRKKTVLDSHMERCGTSPEKHPHLLKLGEVINALKRLEPKRVLFMGGEPTIDPKFKNLAKSTHEKLGARNVLLTNGFILPPLEYIDEACVSLKALNNRLHLDYTGKSNRGLLENFVAFYRSNVKLRSESVFIPGYIDCEEIGDIAKFIAGVSPDIPYRIDGYILVSGTPWRRPTRQEMEKTIKVAREHLNNVSHLKGNERLQHEIIKIV